MSLFSPEIGLHIGKTLSAIQVKRQGGRYTIQRYRILEAPHDLIAPSPLEPNIRDIEQFQKRLKELLYPWEMKKADVALSLPDLAVKVAIFPLESVPKKREELEQLARWRMEQSLLYPLGDVQFSYQLLSRSTRMTDGKPSLLTMAIKREIITQYEESLKGLGFQPVVVNIASFHLFNFFHDRLLKTSGPNHCFVVFNIQDQSFTLMIFQKGMLDFILVKRFMGKDSMDPNGILQALKDSLAFYGERGDASTLSHLFLMGESIDQQLAKQASAEMNLKTEFMEFNPIASMSAPDMAALTPALAAGVGI
ncbi:MAG: pilus assembly protein PilM [Nitrospirae bacterium]|nr:pilus assembly protein PilM [Candidatus Troglogloeales bacterium]MBI3598273.1 pilus assembly protein PilM [Candidatus Troglogloeales bacterium]